MKSVIIPLNAFDINAVLKNGQISFIKLIAESGAYGVEVRRELFSNGNYPLELLRKEIENHLLFTVYSAPIELWKQDGTLNREGLEQIFQEASRLGASWVKVSLGHYIDKISNLDELKQFLNTKNQLKLLVENDQTPYGGSIRNVKVFIEGAFCMGVPVNITFDMGNWVFTNENVYEALAELKDYIVYIHLKSVVQKNKRLITIPLSHDLDAEWRKIVQHFSCDLPKALEFPIESSKQLNEYIKMVGNNKDYEEGDLICKS